MLVRVNEYSPIIVDGLRRIQATTHGVRVNPSQIMRVTTNLVTGYEANGVDTLNVFKVQFNGGLFIWTDQTGIDDINNWEFPIDMP